MKTALITMRALKNDTYVEYRNALAYEYVDFFEKLNFLLILVPNNTKNLQAYFEHTQIDLLILSGGDDLASDDPQLHLRDETERTLAQLALRKGIPILAICRGFELVAEMFGATLEPIKGHVATRHTLQSEIGFLNNRQTNSFHNYGITFAPKGATILAKSGDIIEAFLFRKERILALQWHPERQNDSMDVELIERFLEGEL